MTATDAHLKMMGFWHSSGTGNWGEPSIEKNAIATLAVSASYANFECLNFGVRSTIFRDRPRRGRQI
jgi:hypothetical protein